MHVKSSTYYDHLNHGLLDAIPRSAGLVLEIGCGTGGLGAAWKARQPDALYYGVEIHDVSAEIAATRLDRVWCSSVEDAGLDELTGRVDCLVYGDVLEHLLDPWRVLKAHRRLLAEGGRVVASIPNVQHWTLLRHLLHGYWNYLDHGILDDTHLRFFTLSSIMAMFADAGLSIDSVVGLVPDQQEASAFADAMRPALAALGIDEARFREQIAPLQFVISATAQ